MASFDVAKKWFIGNSPLNAIAAKAETEFGVANAEMVINANIKGVDYNGWKINLIDPKGNSEKLAIFVNETNKTIDISLATSEVGAITTKASDIKTAVEAHAIANKIIAVDYAEENTGAGIVKATELELANGVDGTVCQDINVIVQDDKTGQLYVNILPNSIHDTNWRKLNLVMY